MMIGMLAMPTWADKNKTSEMPDMAFLEFLAELQEVDGQLVSPTDLLDAHQKLPAAGNLSAKDKDQPGNDINGFVELLKLLEEEGTSDSNANTDKSDVANKEGKQ